jgi:methylenetetrahydrofolate dehydrogenase (NADP+)/methenyltetrahydrofolate cyclohydrolase
MLLLAKQATVTIAHSRTRNLKEICRQADILVVAAGRPKLITADMIKPARSSLTWGQ